MYWSSISRLVVFIDVVVPLTVKSPPIIVSFVIDKAPNVTESVCCNPKSTVEPTTPFVVSLTSPCPGDAIEEPDIIPLAATIVASVSGHQRMVSTRQPAD